MIAQAIGAVGLTLACLLPLLLAAYVIHAVNQNGDDSAALSELLVLEITAEQPLLLPIARRPVAALEHTSPPDDIVGVRLSSGTPADYAPHISALDRFGPLHKNLKPAPGWSIVSDNANNFDLFRREMLADHRWTESLKLREFG